MARYDIEISQTAEKQLKKLPRREQQRVVAAVVALGSEPFPRGSRRLTGYDDVWRIRVGQYRVIYSVAKKKLIIIVLKIGQRKDVYR